MREILKSEKTPHWIVAVTAIVGTCFLYTELRHLTKQNDLLQKSVEQSAKMTMSFQSLLREAYRPAAIVDSMKTLHVRVGYSQNAHSLNAVSLLFTLTRSYRNGGPGRMVFLGEVSHLSTDTISFRTAFMNGGGDPVDHDLIRAEDRRRTLTPGEPIVIPIAYDGIPFAPCYNFYSLLFYEDEAGNLYDTQFYQELLFDKAKISPDTLLPGFFDGRFQNYGIHEYTPDEKQKVIKRLGSCFPLLVSYISRS